MPLTLHLLLFQQVCVVYNYVEQVVYVMAAIAVSTATPVGFIFDLAEDATATPPTLITSLGFTVPRRVQELAPPMAAAACLLAA